MEPIPALPTGDVVGDSTADVVVAVFEALYQAERDPMVRLALSMVDDPARAVEIVHDAFERLYLRWGRVREPGAYARCFVGLDHFDVRIVDGRIMASANRVSGAPRHDLLG